MDTFEIATAYFCFILVLLCRGLWLWSVGPDVTVFKWGDALLALKNGNKSAAAFRANGICDYIDRLIRGTQQFLAFGNADFLLVCVGGIAGILAESTL